MNSVVQIVLIICGTLVALVYVTAKYDTTKKDKEDTKKNTRKKS